MNKSIKSRGSAAKIFVCGGGGYEKKSNEGGKGVYPGPDTTIHYKGSRSFSVVYSPCSICVWNDLTGVREQELGGEWMLPSLLIILAILYHGFSSKGGCCIILFCFCNVTCKCRNIFLVVNVVLTKYETKTATI